MSVYGFVIMGATIFVALIPIFVIVPKIPGFWRAVGYVHGKLLP